MELRTHFFLTLFLASVFTGYTLYEVQSLGVQEDLRPIEDIDVGESALRLKTQCFELEITVSESQASNVRSVINGDPSFEHGFALQTLSAEPDKVVIDRIDSGIFQSDIVLENDDRINLRPSDGIVIAYQADIPVYVNEDLITEFGEPTCLDGSRRI